MQAEIPGSFLAWTVTAVLLFWAVGAYNRLVRLRAEANAGFQALDQELRGRVQIIHQCQPQGGDDPAVVLRDGVALRHEGLRAAATQLEAALASARPRPLDAERIAALATACDTLATAWQRAGEQVTPWPPQAQAEAWARSDFLTNAAADTFDAAVGRYNQAIAQFPALVLAWVFGFQQARGLRARD